jgi:hypothetical protein
MQARVKEQETQKKLFNLKRVVCIGGGMLLVLVAWALLIATSKNKAVDPGARVRGGGGEGVSGLCATQLAARLHGQTASHAPGSATHTLHPSRTRHARQHSAPTHRVPEGADGL